MIERTTNRQRQTIVVEDRAHLLRPDETADLSLLAGLLADPSTWAEPPAGLEDAVAEAVKEAVMSPEPAKPPVRRRPPMAALPSRVN